MDKLKQAYAEKIKEKTFFMLNHIVDKHQHSNEDPYLYVVGANATDVDTSLDKYINALPLSFFITNDIVSNNIIEDIINDYILFMSQENITDESFDQNFSNFILFSISEITEKYNL